MKQRVALFCLLLTLIVKISVAHNSITVETHQLNQILRHISEEDHHSKTAIICDLDNTLIEPEHEFGSDQWFCAFSDYLIANNLAKNDDDTDQLLMPIVFKLWEKYEYQLIEEYAPELLHELRARRLTVLGLTARHPFGSGHTHRHLRSLDIRFCHAHCYEDIDLSDRYPALYCNGVLFCDLNEKPDVLARYFNKINYWPTKIVFIDDKLKNVLKMEQFCNKHGIDFVGIRYSKLDSKIKQFKLENTFEHLMNFFQQHPDVPQITGLQELLSPLNIAVKI